MPMEIDRLAGTRGDTMAIYGIGAYYEEDVSAEFINAKLVGVGWSKDDAPELHEFIAKLMPGDIVYIKSGGNVLQRHAIADLRFDARTTLEHLAGRQPDRRQNISFFPILILE